MIDIVASGVLFDMDGTLVDSTAVVEATWTRFGHANGIDPDEILAFSHGRQAIDTLRRFLPDLPLAEQQRIAAESSPRRPRAPRASSRSPGPSPSCSDSSNSVSRWPS